MPSDSTGSDTDKRIPVYSESLVKGFLEENRAAVIDVVADAYIRHFRGQSVVPHSVFLKWPVPPDRIIGLPALLQGDDPVAGLKWVASVPANIDAGIPRASATMFLNSAKTGRLTGILEATHVSSHRTAASAAVTAKALGSDLSRLGVIGCGRIAAETLRYIAVAFDGRPGPRELILNDIARRRAEGFAEEVAGLFPDAAVRYADTSSEVMLAATTTVIASTVSTPYLDGLDLPEQATVLHLSLRDISADIILRHRNVVDDYDHVSRENTSIDLAAREEPSGAFVQGSIGELLDKGIRWAPDDARAIIVSPFGLGVLDLAVAHWVASSDKAAASAQFVDFFA